MGLQIEVVFILEVVCRTADHGRWPVSPTIPRLAVTVTFVNREVCSSTT